MIPLTTRQAIERWIANGWTDSEVAEQFVGQTVELDGRIYYLRSDPGDRRAFAAAVAAIRGSRPKPRGRRPGTTTITRAELLDAYWTERESPTPRRRSDLADPSKERVAERLGRDPRTLDNALVAHGLDWERMPRE